MKRTFTPDTLRKLRHKLGLTQADLADALGVTLNTVSRWELGQAPILKTTAMALECLAHKKKRK